MTKERKPCTFYQVLSYCLSAENPPFYVQVCDPGVVSASFVSAPVGRARGKLIETGQEERICSFLSATIPVLLLLPVLLSLLMSP